MSMKRGKFILFGIIFLVFIVGFVSAQNQEEKDSGFFSQIKKFFGTITGWVTSFANVALEIQSNLQPPENFSIYVLNQSTGITTLNWSASNCAGYKLWYSEDVTEILQLNYSNTNITNQVAANVTLVGKFNTTYNDTSAPSDSERYYALACYTGDEATTSDTKVGKWNITIFSESNVSETFFSFPLEENISIFDVPPPSEDFAVLYTINHTLNDTWEYAYNYNDIWSGDIYEMNLDFGRGHLATSFSDEIPYTNAGTIPTGNTTKIVYGEDNIKQTSLGWDSISTKGNISELITPPNNFAIIYKIDHDANEWTYIYYYLGEWSGTFDEFEVGNGYLFDSFDTAINFTYERNPY